MGKQKKGLEIIKAFALLSQLGLTIALPIFTGVYVGSYLDERLSTGGTLTILLMILGVFGGLTGAYRLIMVSIGRGDERRKEDEE